MDESICREIWEYLITCGGYNSKVDEDIYNVMSTINLDRPIFYDKIAQQLNLKKSHVELIQYILCTMDLAEYGTSPRGCWLTDKGEEWLKMFKNRIDKDKITGN